MVADMETRSSPLHYSGSLGDARTFCEVVERGTLTHAAKWLRESKGSISKRLSRLEAQLGVRLLARTTRAVTPTEEGLEFYAKVRAGLSMLDEAAEGALGLKKQPQGNLRITASMDICIFLLPQLIREFRHEYPGISLEIVASDGLLDLSANRLDLALRVMRKPLPDQPYRSVELAIGHMGFYASPEWLMTHSEPTTFLEVLAADLICCEKHNTARPLPFVDDYGHIEEFQTRASVKTSDLATATRLAEAGVGIALLPSFAAQQALQQGSLIPILPAWRVKGLRMHALSLAGPAVPLRIRLFRDFLKARLRKPST